MIPTVIFVELVQKIGTRTVRTAYGDFVAHAWKDKPSAGVQALISDLNRGSIANIT